MRKVFEVFSEKISLICFGTLFLFFLKTSVTNFFANSQHFIANPPLLRVFLFVET